MSSVWYAYMKPLMAKEDKDSHRPLYLHISDVDPFDPKRRRKDGEISLDMIRQRIHSEWHPDTQLGFCRQVVLTEAEIHELQMTIALEKNLGPQAIASLAPRAPPGARQRSRSPLGRTTPSQFSEYGPQLNVGSRARGSTPTTRNTLRTRLVPRPPSPVRPPDP